MAIDHAVAQCTVLVHHEIDLSQQCFGILATMTEDFFKLVEDHYGK